MSPDILKSLVGFLSELGYNRKELSSMTEDELAVQAWQELAKLLKP
ncbi:hypothetical protein H1164_15100 [Thermoactinomyces daqus]|uniref:Uncharacterized protein n=1 Tax=Thermoactinomyces daqus TaxID=1329516 RepID=A0A7W1XCL2_9BACL|nr:hypothetical protein [Thermoactinomyces daqus]MBA4544189.1 hypothetical protein [Thermoactinomyces daqus]